MSRIRVSPLLVRATLILALTGVSACGGGGVGGDQASKFAGSWTFQSGVLTPDCGAGLTVPPFMLTGLPLVLTKVDDSTIQVVAGSAGCTLTFKVAGAVASATSGQMCTLETGSLGQQTVTVTSWKLTLADERITTDISASVMASILTCTATGSGVLVPGTPDAGTD
jgi:hypothetical protein